MELTLEVAIGAPLIIAGAYCVFGMTGFGNALIALPLLTHLMPLKFALPLFSVIDIVASLTTGLRFRTDIARQELVFLMPSLLVGLAAGVFLLIELPGQTLLLALGVFVFAYGIYAMSGRDPQFKLSRFWTIPVGVVGGAISALFGVAGPIYIIYLTARGLEPSQLRSTMATIFAVTSTTRVLLYAASGLYSQPGILQGSAALIPAMLVGLFIGHRLHVSLPRGRILQLIGGLLVLSGASLVVRAW